jgi:hypothetical protein
VRAMSHLFLAIVAATAYFFCVAWRGWRLERASSGE